MVEWKVGEKEPWRLATNLPDLSMALRFYRKRMWFKEIFGDMKNHGFDLGQTMSRHFDRLSRLTLLLVFLYVWLISIGTHTTRNGLPHLVDRKERRVLSIFQMGLRYMDQCVINSLHCRVIPCSYR